MAATHKVQIYIPTDKFERIERFLSEECNRPDQYIEYSLTHKESQLAILSCSDPALLNYVRGMVRGYLGRMEEEENNG